MSESTRAETPFEGEGAIAVATWNVLHPIHAINWQEAVVGPEAARVRAIAERIATQGDRVWCLQEVSGDQLVALREALPEAAVFSLRYPRVPRLRRPEEASSPLADPSEHLVTLVPARWARGARSVARLVYAAAFPSDPGKGALVVELAGGVHVVNTHVSFGPRMVAQCAELSSLARAAPATAIVLGDFNAKSAPVREQLGVDVEVAPLSASSLPTRPRAAPSERSATIDHVFVRAGEALAARVEDAGGLSDHNLVLAAVRPLARLV